MKPSHMIRGSEQERLVQELKVSHSAIIAISLVLLAIEVTARFVLLPNEHTSVQEAYPWNRTGFHAASFYVWQAFRRIILAQDSSAQ